MADWLKKQAEREAEREQQRAERLQRRLREPEHRFSEQLYLQQSHQLSERLEDSVIKGGRSPPPAWPRPRSPPPTRCSPSRSAGHEWTGEGGPRPPLKETPEPEQRAARQEEQDGHLLVRVTFNLLAPPSTL